MEIVTNEVKAIQTLSNIEVAPVSLNQQTILPGGLRPNPNRVKPAIEVAQVAEEIAALAPQEVKATPTQAEPIQRSVDPNKIKDLDDLLEGHQQIKFVNRLLIKIVLTNPELIGLDDRAVNDMRNVPVSNDKDLNFYSPFNFSKDDKDVSTGFLRKPLVELIKYLSSNNASTYVTLNASKFDVETFIEGFDKAVANCVYKNFGAEDLVTYLESDEDLDIDDEDEDSEDDQPVIAAKDLVEVDSWRTTTFLETGELAVNYTACLSIHCLDVYDAKSKFDQIAKIKKTIVNIATKFDATNLSVGLAVILDNKLLTDPNILDTIEEFSQHEEDMEPEYDFVTFDDVKSLAEDRDEAVSSLEEDSLDLWVESDELYPSVEDLNRLIKPSEFMYYMLVTEPSDTLEDSNDNEDEGE